MTPPVPKPERSPAGRDYREKAIETAKKIVRLPGICEKCGRTKKRGFVMHGVHIMPVRFGSTAADPDNIICLCGFCHVADDKSAHLNERDFHKWFDEKYQGRRDALRAKANQVFTGDWSDVYEALLLKFKVALEEQISIEQKEIR